MTKFNETYSCRHHKYTINLPIELMKEAQVKSKLAGFNEVAPYFRAILSREMTAGNLSIQDILGEKEFKHREYLNKHRREISKYSFVSLPAKNFLDKVRKLGVYFRSSSDQLIFEF